MNIVKHIQKVSFGNTQIYSMDLVFKLDYDNKLWLLMCTGIKIREKFKQFVEKEDGVETNTDLRSKT